MENENINNSKYYGLCEKTIKNTNYDLWQAITDYSNLDIEFKIKFYMYENNIVEIPKCECGNDVKFIDMKSGFREFCCRKCMNDSQITKEKKKKTCIEIYGVDNPSKAQQIKEKVKSTNRKLFGVDYPLQSQENVNKLRNTFINKYGVDNPSKIREIREKAENTMIKKFGVPHAMQNEEVKQNLKDFFMEKYGVDNPFYLKEVQEKKKETMILKYGTKHPLLNSVIMNKLKETNIEKYGNISYLGSIEHRNNLNIINNEKISDKVNDDRYTLISRDEMHYTILCSHCNKEFTINRKFWKKRKDNNEEICLHCNPCMIGMSYAEKEISDFIRSIYNGEIKDNDKTYRKEIDIYIPDLKIGFEYNGLYWHSETRKPKEYHYDKFNHFKDNNIEIYQIWEDDWKYKQDIVKSIITNKLGLSNKLNSDNYIIKEVSDNNIIRKFMNKNHIDGFIGSKIRLGLYIDDKLVSMMLFGKIKDNSCELLRFCNILNTDVIDSDIKLFNYFLSNYNIDEITYYNTNELDEHLQDRLGFYMIKKVGIDFYWSSDKIRYNRNNFRKNKLIEMGNDGNLTESEIMTSNRFLKIYNSGGMKYKYIKN